MSTEQPKEPQAETVSSDQFYVEELVETTEEDGKKVAKRGVVLLPNLLTSAAIFSGFYACMASIQALQLNDPKYFAYGAIAIFVSMLFDGLDGRVARMLNVQSKFGAEYDSLADMMSFGVAPAILAYNWGLMHMGKLGWMAAFIYLVCAALRLARFNTMLDNNEKRYFIGLASPAAAALVASFIWMCVDYGWDGAFIYGCGLLITLAAGLLMVSNIKFRSFKDLEVGDRIPLIALLAILLVFAVVALKPDTVLACIIGAYALSGPVSIFVRKLR